MPQDHVAAPVLVLTEPDDVTADLVINGLQHRGVPLVRVDPADFPRTVSISAMFDDSGWSGGIWDAYRRADLGTVQAVYYRRPGTPRMSAQMTAPEREWSTREAVAGVLGVIGALDCRWVNHPARNATCSVKPLQLAVAARCGLQTPRTLVTNNPDEAREFARQVGRLVFKPLHGGTVIENGVPMGAFTSVVDPADIDESVRTTAHCLQQFVPKSHEVRLTVVGDRMFPAEIHAGSKAAQVDWRADYDALTYRAATTVPTAVRAGVVAFMTQFKLRFAAFDFVVTPSGDWVFLECNPNGQYGWIEDHLPELRITTALVDLLIQGDQPQ